MLETACIVAFFGFLRCGEFTVKQANTFDSSVNLCVFDVIFNENYALLKLKNEKQTLSGKEYLYNYTRLTIMYAPFRL